MNPATRAIAHHELRTRWRSLVVLGVVAGIAGGSLLAGAVLARRTESAPDRLVTAVAPGDVRVDLYGSASTDAVATLPGVEQATRATIAVGRIRGAGFVYAGMVVPDADDEALLNPVVVAGRPTSPTADDEVVVVEDVAEALDLSPGDRISLDLLTSEEIGQFDTGFGEPDGPALDLLVAGVIRTPPDVLAGTPFLASPAVATVLGDGAAGWSLFVDLADDEPTVRDDFEEAVMQVGTSAEPVEGRDELPPVVVTDLGGGTAEARASTAVMVAGVVAALAVGLVALLAVLWQSFARHHGASGSLLRVESALGLTAHEQALSHTLPASITAAVAAGIALPLAAMAGLLDPPGAAGRLEPDPGWRADPLAVGVGAVAMGAVVLAIAYATARRAGRPLTHAPSGRPTPRWAPRRRGWPLLGTTFALSSGSRDGLVPTRASLAGTALGVAGIVATITIGASLHQLVGTPARWGWNADVAVVDVTDQAVDELVDDPRIRAVTEVGSASLQIGGSPTQTYALDPVVGDLGWTVLTGRHPVDDSEVLLGSRLSRALGVDVGDAVVAGSGAGDEAQLTVVGVGVGPTLSGERLGEAAVVTDATLRQVAPVQLFREALVDAADPEREAVVDDLGGRYEIAVAEAPRSVRDRAELDRLPTLLGWFLAVLGGAALLHALVVATHRRRRDLAVLRALGGSTRHLRLTILAMSAVTATAGVVVGLPLGLATARLVWGEVARGVGVAPDISIPSSIVLVALAVPLASLALAAWPATRAGRGDDPAALRQE